MNGDNGLVLRVAAACPSVTGLFPYHLCLRLVTVPQSRGCNSCCGDLESPGTQKPSGLQPLSALSVLGYPWHPLAASARAPGESQGFPRVQDTQAGFSLARPAAGIAGAQPSKEAPAAHRSDPFHLVPRVLRSSRSSQVHISRWVGLRGEELLGSPKDTQTAAWGTYIQVWSNHHLCLHSLLFSNFFHIIHFFKKSNWTPCKHLRRQRHADTYTLTHTHTVNAIPRPKIASQQDHHLGSDVITSKPDRWIEVPCHPPCLDFSPGSGPPAQGIQRGIVCSSVGPDSQEMAAFVRGLPLHSLGCFADLVWLDLEIVVGRVSVLGPP